MTNHYIDYGRARLKRVDVKMAEEQNFNFKLFDLYDVSGIEVKEAGLKRVINLEPKLILKSQGRNVKKFGQCNVNIVERLINRLHVAGHRNKKNKIALGVNTGKYAKNAKIVLSAFEMIAKKTGKNPVAVLVEAIEKAAPRDEITVIEYGGARYPQAVDISPIRRVNLVLRYITNAAGDKAFGKKKAIAEALAEEIMLTAEGNGESVPLRKKNESEKQADAAR